MRISIIQDDPGYHSLAFGTEVFLDGKPLKGCITADDDKGCALINSVNEFGDYYISTEFRDAVATEWVYGKVKILLPDHFVAKWVD